MVIYAVKPEEGNKHEFMIRTYRMNRSVREDRHRQIQSICVLMQNRYSRWAQTVRSTQVIKKFLILPASIIAIKMFCKKS